jgi:hypothetical protein
MRLIFLVLLLLLLSGCVDKDYEMVVKGPEQGVGIDDQNVQKTRSRLAYDSSPLIADFSYSYRQNSGQGSPRSLQNGSELHSGDYYKIQFTPKQECYVYIFQYDSSFQLFTLFPTKDFIGGDSGNDNPVQAKRTYFVPGEGKSFILDKQAGDETIHFLLSKKPKPELEKEYKALLEFQKRGDEQGAQKAQTKIKKYVMKGPQPTVIYDDGSVVKGDQQGMFRHVQGRRLECKRSKYCVESITFKHLP